MYLLHYHPHDRSGAYIARPVTSERRLFSKISKDFDSEEKTAPPVLFEKDARNGTRCSLRKHNRQRMAIVIKGSGGQPSSTKHSSKMKLTLKTAKKPKRSKHTANDANDTGRTKLLENSDWSKFDDIGRGSFPFSYKVWCPLKTLYQKKHLDSRLGVPPRYTTQLRTGSTVECFHFCRPE